jgi:integrase
MKEHIDGNTLRKVRNWMKEGMEVKVFDDECSGFAIRTYKSGKASWCILTRDWKHTLADLAVYKAEDVPKLREVVAKARQMRADGNDPDPFLKSFVGGSDVTRAGHDAAVAAGAMETWEQARDAYLASLLEDNARDTYRSYRSAIGAVPGSPLEKDFEPFHGKPLAAIAPDNIVAVRDNVHLRGKPKGPGAHVRQANATLAVNKAFFAWQMGRRGNPLTTNPAVLVPKVKKTAGTGGKASKGAGASSALRAMSQDECGLVVLGLEWYPNVAARTATLLQLMTGQRRMTVCEARKEAFEDHPVYGMVWRLEDKVRSWRVLPLPPTAAAAVRTAMLLTRPDNPYLFPQQRERKAGDGAEGHMNERTMSEVLEDLRALGGILSGLPFSVSTHKLRKAFVSRMSSTMHKYVIGERRLTEKDIEMITHMDEGREGTASQVYDLNPHLDVKFEVLTEWEQWVLEGYHRVKERADKGTGALPAAAE